MTELNHFLVKFCDLDQLNNSQLDTYHQSIKDYFLSIKDNHFLRIQFFENEAILSSEELLRPFPEAKIIPYRENFFGETIIHSNTVISEDYFKLNASYYRIFYCKELPHSLSLSELQYLCPFYLNILKLPTKKAKGLLDLKRKLNNADLNYEIKNYDAHEAKDQAEELLESVSLGHEAIFEVELFFILKSANLDDLSTKTKELLNLSSTINFNLKIEDIGLSSSIQSLLPSNRSTFKRSHQTPLSYLINLLPLYNDFIHEKGIPFLSRHLRPTNLDLFDESSNNFNLLISGLSGSGKSALCQKIIFEQLQNGSAVIVLDKGASFIKLTKYLKGKTFDQFFDPLLFKCPTYLKEILISQIPKKELNPKIEGQILKTLKLTDLSKINTFETLLSIFSKEFPDLSLYFEELLPFFKRTEYEKQNFIYVDTQNYPQKIVPTLIIFLIQYFKSLNGQKLFVFDESWQLLENNISFLSESFRTFRKIGASSIAITQNYADLNQNLLGKTISNNSFYKCLFAQETHEIKEFNNFDKENIKSLRTIKGKFSEFYLKTPFHQKILRFYPTELEYELFSTHHQDLIEFWKFHDSYKDHFPFKTIIENYTNFKYQLNNQEDPL